MVLLGDDDMNDQALEYNTLLNNVKLMISNIKELYMCLYEQNKHLIDNPTELYQRFEDLEKEFSLSSEEVKKLVRTKA